MDAIFAGSSLTGVRVLVGEFAVGKVLGKPAISLFNQYIGSRASDYWRMWILIIYFTALFYNRTTHSGVKYGSSLSPPFNLLPHLPFLARRSFRRGCSLSLSLSFSSLALHLGSSRLAISLLSGVSGLISSCCLFLPAYGPLSLDFGWFV